MGKSLMEDLVIEKLSTVYDPEVPVNIWELGLVYSIEFPKQKPAWSPERMSETARLELGFDI